MTAPSSISAPPDRAPSRAELDARTLARARRGDAQALRAVIERHQRPVYAVISRMMRPHQQGLVDDLAQETFLRVCRALPGFAPDGPARLSTWILTIAARLTIDAQRKASRPETLMAEPPDQADPRPDPERQVAARARHAALTAAIEALPDGQRAVVVLRLLQGLSEQATAEALSVSQGTVKSRLSRARDRLRAAMEAEA